ncbi:MAG TPA: VCBS repeat-containing protein, partial [bacterium]|nr:VCBS repeat-containing protein [bacterium]
MRVPAAAASTLVLFGFPELARGQLSLVEIQAGTLTTDYYECLTNHGLGINWIDYDNDDWPDIFLINGKGLSPHLYRNNGDGTFTNRDDLLPGLPDVEMTRSAFGDYDRDGDVDIYIWTDHPAVILSQPNAEDGPLNLLLKNQWMETGEVPGQPLFTEVAQPAGVADSAAVPLGPDPGMRAKTGFWFDHDRDGDLDLMVGHWVPQSGGRPANQDRLFRNEGDGTFSDVSFSSGFVDTSDTTAWRPALASIGAHLDDDLWPDIYVVNTVDSLPYHGDQIFRNNGDGTFSDVTALSPGVGDDCEAGMGIDVGDLDHDGDWDAYISDLRTTALDSLPLGNPFYLNNGDGTFQDNSAPAAGLVGTDSWGVSYFDLDQDGYEDIFLATMGGAGLGASFVYRNKKDGTFQKSPGVGLNLDARGSATADFDRDGDLDIAQIVQRNNV